MIQSVTGNGIRRVRRLIVPVVPVLKADAGDAHSGQSSRRFDDLVRASGGMVGSQRVIWA